MTIISKSKNEKMTVALAGRLDAAAIPELEAFFGENLDGVKRLELDMKKLDSISSAGFRLLVSVRERMAEQNGYVLIKHIRDEVLSLFELTGFADKFVIK